MRKLVSMNFVFWYQFIRGYRKINSKVSLTIPLFIIP
jgi:hypothetical protein